MQEALVLMLLSIIGVVILGSFFTAILVLFPKLIHRTAEAANLMHGRAFFLGVVNLAFFIILTFVSGSIGDQTGSLLLQVLAVILIGIVLVGLGLGLAGMTLLAGKQIIPDQSQIKQIACGSGLLILGSLTPFLGWFLLLPYLCFRGVGGLFLGIFQWRALGDSQESDEDE